MQGKSPNPHAALLALLEKRWPESVPEQYRNHMAFGGEPRGAVDVYLRSTSVINFRIGYAEEDSIELAAWTLAEQEGVSVCWCQHVKRWLCCGITYDSRPLALIACLTGLAERGEKQ